MGDRDPAQQAYTLGREAWEANDYDGIITNYTRALELEPGTPNALEAYIYRGEARAAKGDFDGSEADFKLGLALNPKFPITYWLRSKARMLKGDYDGTIAIALF